MWSPWSQQSCRKRPQALFLPYRETPSHSWHVISFPQLTISHLGLKLWPCTTKDSGSFALQFNLMTVARLYPPFSSSCCWEFFSGIVQTWNYPLPKVFSLWAKLPDPDPTERSERAKLEALHHRSCPGFLCREVFSGGNTYVQKDTYSSVASVKHLVSRYVNYSFSEDWFKQNTVTPLR